MIGKFLLNFRNIDKFKNTKSTEYIFKIYHDYSFPLLHKRSEYSFLTDDEFYSHYLYIKPGGVVININHYIIKSDIPEGGITLTANNINSAL